MTTTTRSLLAGLCLAGALSLSCATMLHAAPKARQQQLTALQREKRAYVADLCLGYGWYASELAMYRNQGVPLALAQSRMRLYTALVGYIVSVQQDFEEMTFFVYENPAYTPDMARDAILLWCTQIWLPVAMR